MAAVNLAGEAIFWRWSRSADGSCITESFLTPADGGPWGVTFKPFLPTATTISFDLSHSRLPSCTPEIVSPGDSCHNDTKNADDWSLQKCGFLWGGFRRCARWAHVCRTSWRPAESCWNDLCWKHMCFNSESWQATGVFLRPKNISKTFSLKDRDANLSIWMTMKEGMSHTALFFLGVPLPSL